MADLGLVRLLSLLDIERVLVVDDQFVPPAAVYTLAYEEGKGPELEGLPPLSEGDHYEAHVEQHWAEVPLEAKLKLRKEALKLDGFEDPTGDPTGVRRLIGDCYFRGMTLHEWNSDKEKLLVTSQRTLLLFDVNFALESGELDDEKGLAVAGEALHEAADHVIGLLTTKAEKGDEVDAAGAWAAKADIERADLVVINKNLISSSASTEDVELLAEQFRAALQASRIKKLREEVQASIEQGLEDTATSIAGNTPQVLEDLVFRASREGGKWEGDTWFRLYGTLGMKQARERVAGDKNLRRAIKDVRNLLHEKPEAPHDASKALASKVEQAEAYDDAEYLNGAGLPIANGDLFQAKGGSVFVLVGQPCDLALRPDGRAKNPSAALLLPVKKADAEEDEEEGDAERSAYTLPSGGPLGKGEWEVRFRPEYHADFDVLDLVSFNSEGKASLKPSKGKGLDPLLPGLQGRHRNIKKVAEKAGKLLEAVDVAAEDESLDKRTANELRQKVLGGGGPFKATLGGSPTPYAFSCRRIGRLTGTYADALLSAHAAARSRTAHAHDLTRIVANESP